jgi:hypothetical protein
MSRKILFLHIGTHKTGSTAIQNFFFRNRAKLYEYGLLYPEQGLEGTGHHKVAWACGTKRRKHDPAYIKQFFLSLEELAGNDKVKAVFLSSEEFESVVDISCLGQLSEFFDVRIIVYLRKQDHYLEAAYNQHLRQYDLRFCGSIIQFKDKYDFLLRFNYRRRLAQWENCFGRESLVVRPYGTRAVLGNVCDDILNVLQIEPGWAERNLTSPERDNVSLPAETLPYLARLNSRPLSPEQHQDVMSALRNSIPKVENSRLLNVEESAAFYGNFADDNRYVRARYLGGNGDLFEDMTTNESKQNPISHEAIDTELLYSILHSSAQ